MRRIVIKIGSKVLTKDDGLLDEDRIFELAREISNLRNKYNTEVIIVSSGAVLSGSAVLNIDNFSIISYGADQNKQLIKEQVLASIGQVALIAKYKEMFQKYDIVSAQVLATRRDFANRLAYLNLKTVTENLLQLKVCPIFNENDVLSQEKLDFTDNDQLAYMVAAMTCSDCLIILTNVDGVFDGLTDDNESNLISEIVDVTNSFDLINDVRSKGKGGMRSKLLAADIVTSLGIPMYIANGTKKNVISRIVSGSKIGTFFPAKNCKKTGIKTWLATAAAGNGKIIASTYLADILREHKPASILFSGIESIVGQFDNKDVVEICDYSGSILAKGIVKFSSDDLRLKVEEFAIKSDAEKAQLKSNEIIAVHYDYLVFV